MIAPDCDLLINIKFLVSNQDSILENLKYIYIYIHCNCTVERKRRDYPQKIEVVTYIWTNNLI